MAVHTTCSGKPEMPRKTSRRNMKNYGARPFDEKEWGMTREQLHAKIRLFEENNRWFFRNEERLRKKYPDQWVAVENGRVIVADADQLEVLKKLKARPGGRGATCVEFVSRVKYELIV